SPSRSAARAAASPTWRWPAGPTRAGLARRWRQCGVGWRSGFDASVVAVEPTTPVRAELVEALYSDHPEPVEGQAQGERNSLYSDHPESVEGQAQGEREFVAGQGGSRRI